MKTIFLSVITFTTSIMVVMAQSYVPEYGEKIFRVEPVVDIEANAFNIADVKLKPGIFKQAMEAHRDWLLSLEPDRLLSGYLEDADLEPKAEKYGSWESSGLNGHSLGHYLSALSLYYATSKDQEALTRINYIVDELKRAQDEKGTGYVAAIPQGDDLWYRVALGDIRTGGFSLNGAWAPWYVIHKEMAGLLDAYIYTGNEKALQVNIGLADWAYNLLRGLTYDEFQQMLRCEYGGMNEVLANTYAITGKDKYLELSRRFHDEFVNIPLENRLNPMPGKHSNTNVPKLIGAARRYQITGDRYDHIASSYFWDVMVDHHTYAPGGNANYEYLGPEDELNDKLTNNTMETCNTYNMLKLTRQLFSVNPSARYMDYYERALYNHILASQDRENAEVCYFVPLKMGARKGFHNSFTCCVGSGMENHVKYGESIYFRGADGSLFVNLFIPSELQWSENETVISLDSDIPSSDEVKITVSPKAKKELTLRIRKPEWAETEITFEVNGKTTDAVIDDYGYYAITRTWKKGDELVFNLPMGLYARTMPDNENRMAFFYGPVMLAGDVGDEEPDPARGIPTFVTDAHEVADFLQPRGNNIFASANVGKPHDVEFRPFYDFYDDYYSVYWDVYDHEEWKEIEAKMAEERAIQAAVEARTVDVMRFEMQPERDHSLTEENSFAREDNTRRYRSAREGFFEFDMKVDAVETNQLVFTYYGQDNRNRRFDILVDGNKIADENLGRFHGDRFYDIFYKIPAELTDGKASVRVRIQSIGRSEAGPVYGVRMIRGDDTTGDQRDEILGR